MPLGVGIDARHWAPATVLHLYRAKTSSGLTFCQAKREGCENPRRPRVSPAPSAATALPSCPRLLFFFLSDPPHRWCPSVAGNRGLFPSTGLAPQHTRTFRRQWKQQDLSARSPLGFEGHILHAICSLSPLGQCYAF